MIVIFRRLASRFAGAGSLVHLALVVGGFVTLRVILALRNGIVVAGDNAAQAGSEIGEFWIGALSFDQLVHGGGYAPLFLSQRSSQLLYPLLISLHRPLGLDLATHVLIVNTALGATLVTAAYLVGLRLHGKGYALLVALLTCGVTGLYWIGRFALVDNVFYALIPLLALSILHWNRRRTLASAAVMIAGLAALVLTRPESIFVVLFVGLVVAWHQARRSYSRNAVLACLVAGLTAAAMGTVAVIAASPSMQNVLWTRAHVAWGLAGSAHTLLNRDSSEFDALLARYTAGQYPGPDNMHYRMSMDAIETIRSNPAWYVAKIPIRGVAIMFPWTYQNWSLRHVLYEAVYTIFVTTGLVLLFRRRPLGLPVSMLVAIPLAIWVFLSAYLIDNDLKHRNGILVALNLIAPLGYFVQGARRGLMRSADAESE